MELNLTKNIFGELFNPFHGLSEWMKISIHRFHLRLLRFSHFVAAPKQKRNMKWFNNNSHGYNSWKMKKIQQRTPKVFNNNSCG